MLARITSKLLDLGVDPGPSEPAEHRRRALTVEVLRYARHEHEPWQRRVDFFAGLRWAGVPVEMALMAIGPAVTVRGSAGWRSAFGAFDLANRWHRYAGAFSCPLELAETLIASDVYSRGIAMVRETFVQDYIGIRAQPVQWRSVPLPPPTAGGTLRTPPGHKEALKRAGRLKPGDAPELDMVSVGELIGLEMARHDLHPEDRIRERNAAYRVQVSNRGTNAWRTRGWPTAGDPWDRREVWRWVRRAPHPHEQAELCRWVYERSDGAGPSLPARVPERIYKHDPRETGDGERPVSRIAHVPGLDHVEVQVGIQDQSGEDVEVWSR